MSTLDLNGIIKTQPIWAYGRTLVTERLWIQLVRDINLKYSFKKVADDFKNALVAKVQQQKKDRDAERAELWVWSDEENATSFKLEDAWLRHAETAISDKTLAQMHWHWYSNFGKQICDQQLLGTCRWQSRRTGIHNTSQYCSIPQYCGTLLCALDV